MGQSVITRVVRVAPGRFAPGQLGELTQQVPFEMVDAVLAQTGAVQSRVRNLPAEQTILVKHATAVIWLHEQPTQ